jgi:hypothetical protein
VSHLHGEAGRRSAQGQFISLRKRVIFLNHGLVGVELSVAS